MPEPQARELKVNYSKKKSFWMTLGVIFLLLILNQMNLSIFQVIESVTVDDIRYPVRGERKPEAPVAIVAIDENSLREIGQWPWPRSIHAQLIRKLKADGAKVVFYDVFFPEPERNQAKAFGQLQTLLDSSMQGTNRSTRAMKEKVLESVRKFQGTQDGDEIFAQALKETHNVLLPILTLGKTEKAAELDEADMNFTAADYQPELEDHPFWSENFLVSIPKLQKAALDAGNIRPVPESDGVFRYYPAIIRYGKEGKYIPFMALQAARYLLGVKDPIKIYSGDHAEIGDRKIPLLDNDNAFIDYCGKPGIIPTFSASDILNDRLKPEQLAQFKGAAILVGATAQGLYDLRPTPYSHVSPGVELNATIVENVYSNHFKALAPDYWKLLLIVLMAMLMWYLVPRYSPFLGILFFLVLLVGYVGVACVCFDHFKTILNVTFPSLSLLLTFMMLTTYKFRTEVRHSRYMKQMFQSMVAPSVVEEILKLPAGIELGGEEKNLTVMFSDVRGFTTYSEKHTPHEVVEVLNEYLTQMTYLVFQTEGTLDKYIGDAIMAFWGAPTHQPDNAYRACSTALGMVDLLHNVLHPKWELEGKEKLQIGIGLNSGPMVVGFVGSESIKSYTLIGDAVNLGSRLEGTTKEYHVEIIIAESTYEQVKNDMLCRELDLIKVKGKNEPIRIYELVDHRLKGAGVKESKVKAFEEGLALYREQKWDEAVKGFKKCLELDPKDGPAEIFIKRCEQLRQNPPGKGWDGVFVMKTK
ncbi:MAG TPA: CHASE2 domain-containing protein [bacterium]|nr:CHASE2 domain-containing protein [bacterium]